MAKNELSNIVQSSSTRSTTKEFKYLPLGSLLPELSSLSELQQAKDSLAERLETLQAQGLNTEQAEINMLQQVMQWLEIQ